MPSSEQMAVGGNETVRGYDEREAFGDSGLMIANEIRTPPITFGKILPFLDAAGAIQFLAFMDYATIHVHTSGLNSVNPNVDLRSVGAGFRYSPKKHFILNFDYGWQWKDSGASLLTRNGSNSRGHLYLTVNY